MKYTCEAMRRMSSNQDPWHHYHPYRHRKNSTTSTYSDDMSSCSPSSSSSSTTPPPPYDVSSPPPTSSTMVYNLLKQYIGEVPKDPTVCQILLESLSQVIELERQLADLEQKTNHLKMAQTWFSPPPNYNQTPPKMHHNVEKVPEDLANVDVTEFKHLVHSAPLVYESISY
uniref:Uncharacterized protein n=1 Tax=Caenorhabditis japonica TaxID=281687 RepID=A0A8R1E054_CAEJA